LVIRIAELEKVLKSQDKLLASLSTKLASVSTENVAQLQSQLLEVGHSTEEASSFIAGLREAMTVLTVSRFQTAMAPGPKSVVVFDPAKVSELLQQEPQ